MVRMVNPATNTPTPGLAVSLLRLIEAFENRLGVLLTFYDYTGRIAPYLPVDRLYHRQPFCRFVNGTVKRCSAFEHGDHRSWLAGHPEGFFKRCYFGLWEFSVPIREEGRVLGVVMAGAFRERGVLPSFADEGILSSSRHERHPPGSAKLREKLTPLSEEAVRGLPEMMRAFGSRVESLLAGGHGVVKQDRERRWLVESLIGRMFACPLTLADLARELGVSTERARHIVKDLFGQTFSELLRKHRIAQAKQLLLHSQIPIPEIAEECGFSDASNFHKCFRELEKNTPGAFRHAHKEV
ncbi:helix-turn-helix domain-containing protein [Opitutaceae bacterium TAV3]|nr:helix-turn-helix domain-containing protein [Opitutaceae bacterium TAV3]